MLFAIYVLAIFAGLWLWTIGCWTCCALVASSPIGALSCLFWARCHGWNAARCTGLGALYWAAGFMPWLYFALQMNGRPAPRRLITAIYVSLFITWLIGPVLFGFVWISEDPFFRDRGWLVLHPIANLLAWMAALACLMSAKVLPASTQRVHICHVVPSLLGTLAMLSWLPYVLLVP